MKYINGMIIAMLMVIVTIGGNTVRREFRSGDKTGTSGGVTNVAFTQTTVATEVTTAGSFQAERQGFEPW